MIDIFDMIHYLIGFVILGLLLWVIIKTHNFFSRNNKVIASPTNVASKMAPASSTMNPPRF